MTQKIVIVDYGMGNVRSIERALGHASLCRAEILISRQISDIAAADRLVLPGQGAMPDCLLSLERSGLRAPLLQAMQSKPTLGICLGMQMLLDESEEGPSTGLGLIAGQVKRFAARSEAGEALKVPQIGWNQVWQTQQHPLWQGIADGENFYFVHSFYAAPRDPAHCAARTQYGIDFASAIFRANIFAVQFHPEKSADAGQAFYRNFLSWRP